MVAVTRHVVSATAAVVLSLALSGGYAAGRVADARVTGGRLPTRILPPAVLAEFLPPQAQRRRPANAQARASIAEALLGDPLNPRLFNLWYVSQSDCRGEVPPAALARDARLLKRLGWRHTPALQNLLIREIVREDVPAMLDTVDALLRRQELTGPSIAVIEAAEQVPEGRRLVLQRLRAGVPWRDAVLVGGGNNRTAAFQTGRLATLRGLIAGGQRLERGYLEGFVAALVAAGRAREASDLWSSFAGPPPRGSLLRDPDFTKARRLGDVAGSPTAFEWTLSSGIGYSAIAAGAGQGLAIDWGGRGAPLFASQTIVPRGALPKTLVIDSDPSARLDVAMRPTLSCGGRELVYRFAGRQGGRFRFVLDGGNLPCSAPTFAIGGAPDTGLRSVNLAIRNVSLS